MRHVRRFRRRHGDPVVGRYGHAFRLDTDVDLTGDLALVEIEDGRHRIVLVGDEHALAVARDHELLGVAPGWQVVEEFVAGSLVNLHCVAIAGTDVEMLEVAAERDPARTLAHGERARYLHRTAVDHRDGIVFFVGNIDLVRANRRRGPAQHDGHQHHEPHGRALPSSVYGSRFKGVRVRTRLITGARPRR